MPTSQCSKTLFTKISGQRDIDIGFHSQLTSTVAISAKRERNNNLFCSHGGRESGYCAFCIFTAVYVCKSKDRIRRTLHSINASISIARRKLFCGDRYFIICRYRSDYSAMGSRSLWIIKTSRKAFMYG